LKVKFIYAKIHYCVSFERFCEFGTKSEVHNQVKDFQSRLEMKILIPVNP